MGNLYQQWEILFVVQNPSSNVWKIMCFVDGMSTGSWKDVSLTQLYIFASLLYGLENCTFVIVDASIDISFVCRKGYTTSATIILSLTRLQEVLSFVPDGRARVRGRPKLRVFVNSALKIQCHVVKNTLLQTAFFGDFAHWVVPRENYALVI